MANKKKKTNSKARSNTVKAKSNVNKNASTGNNNSNNKTTTTKTVKRANGTTVKKKVNTNNKNNTNIKKAQIKKEVTNSIKKEDTSKKVETVKTETPKKVETKVKEAPKKVETIKKEDLKKIDTPKKEEVKIDISKEEKEKKEEELSKTKTISIKDLPIRPDIKSKSTKAKGTSKAKEEIKAKAPVKAPEPVKSLTSNKKDTVSKKDVTPLPTREEVRKAKSSKKENIIKEDKLPTREEVKRYKKNKEETTKEEDTKLIVTVSPKKEFKAVVKQSDEEDANVSLKPLKKTKKATSTRSNNDTIKMGGKSPKDLKKKTTKDTPKEEKDTVVVVKKRKKLNVRNLILIIILLGSISMVVVSAVYLIDWEKDNQNTEKVTNEIYNMTTIEDSEDNANTVIIESKEPKENPYWDYIKLPLMNVDFSELKQKNPDTKGFIHVAGTNINYPFVQAKDNEYYLNRSFDKSYNGAGWVFLDYENDINNLDQNTILYAHGRLDTTMFGSLKNIFRTDWYNNINNHIVKLSTETENTLWQVFSVYITPNTNDYITTSFATDAQYQKFLDTIIARSQMQFNTSVTTADKVLTLSTCYNTDDKKVVLHAKLIKKEAR